MMPLPEPHSDAPEQSFPPQDLIPYDEIEMPAEDWEGYEVEILNAILE